MNHLDLEARRRHVAVILAAFGARARVAPMPSPPPQSSDSPVRHLDP